MSDVLDAREVVGAQPYRAFAKDEGFAKNRATYDINNLYRYEACFQEPPEAALAHFADIPFLNRGLFECLDRTEEATEKKRYLDEFSRNAKKPPHVPDRLFFDSGETADLSEVYDDKKRKAEKVTGLIQPIAIQIRHHSSRYRRCHQRRSSKIPRCAFRCGRWRQNHTQARGHHKASGYLISVRAGVMHLCGRWS